MFACDLSIGSCQFFILCITCIILSTVPTENMFIQWSTEWTSKSVDRSIA